MGDSDVQVRVVEVDLTALIRNLWNNAMRYIPTGGHVDLTVSGSDHVTKLVINDSGPGIPDEDIERVFDPLYRIFGGNEVGSGLGLSIVKTITTNIRAHIRVGYSKQKSKTGLDAIVAFFASADQSNPVSASVR